MVISLSGDASSSSTLDLTDPEALRDRDDVPFHEETDVVDEETFEVVADLGNLAPVGVTNEDGEVLLLRVTDTCDRKVPSAGVEPGEDYAAAAREWVAEQAGIDVELDSLEGVWYFEARLEDTERTASRYFVLFSATPVADGDEPADELPDDHEAEEAGWYAELPDDAVLAPGSDRFFD